MKYINLKNQYKAISAEIKELKSHRKLDKRGNWRLYDLDYKIKKQARIARHLNIAYGLLRGREYGQIERTCRTDPDHSWIQRIMDEHKGDSNGEENVRACT